MERQKVWSVEDIREVLRELDRMITKKRAEPGTFTQ